MIGTSEKCSKVSAADRPSLAVTINGYVRISGAVRGAKELSAGERCEVHRRVLDEATRLLGACRGPELACSMLLWIAALLIWLQGSPEPAGTPRFLPRDRGFYSRAPGRR